jgi:hypothetical protein
MVRVLFSEEESMVWVWVWATWEAVKGEEV